MRASWETLVIGVESATAALAGFSAARFLRRHARERRAGRGTALLALGLSTAGAALLAVHGVARDLGGEAPAGATAIVGLPALIGQALLALLARRGSRRQT